MKELKGIGASLGIAIADAFILKEETPLIKKHSIKDVNNEIKQFENAIVIAKEQIESLKINAKKTLGIEKAMVFDAHLAILTDPELSSQINDLVKKDKVNISYAIDKIANQFKQIFLSMDDPYMQERAADVSDVTGRIIKIIQNIEIKDLTLIDTEVVIVANDLTPSQTSQLNPKFVKAFVTEVGGRTSHSAIMARTLEIPAVVGVGKHLSHIKNGQKLLIDGSIGQVIINPEQKFIDQSLVKAKNLKNNREIELTFKDKQTKSLDNKPFITSANIGSPKDLQGVIDNGAEGIGLFRSEFLYMEATSWPKEEEQFLAYKKVLEKMGTKEVVIRTIDVGGDKNLSYYKFPKEMNPFLGYRAIRLQLDQKKVLNNQFRALLRASVFGNLSINVPMIATIEEFTEVKNNFLKIEQELLNEGKKVGKYKLGIMVEIPSVVEMADKFAKHVDFFSIGTNDLIQYTFAADRMSPSVSYLYQPFNPAILRKIKRVIDASHEEKKRTAICGEMAGEPLLTPLLVGMGLDEFSMSSSSILKIRKLIAQINTKKAQKLVSAALNVETQDEVIKLVNEFLVNEKITF